MSNLEMNDQEYRDSLKSSAVDMRTELSRKPDLDDLTLSAIRTSLDLIEKSDYGLKAAETEFVVNRPIIVPPIAGVDDLLDGLQPYEELSSRILSLTTHILRRYGIVTLYPFGADGRGNLSESLKSGLVAKFTFKPN